MHHNSVREHVASRQALTLWETHIVAMQGFDAVQAVEFDQESVGVGQDMSMVLWKQCLQHLHLILPPRHTNTFQTL